MWGSDCRVGVCVFRCPVPPQPCPNSSYPIYLPQVPHSSPVPQPYLEYPPCPISLPRGIPPSYLPLLRGLFPLHHALVLSIFILPQTPTPVPHSPVWGVNPLRQSPVWGITLPQSPVPHPTALPGVSFCPTALPGEPLPTASQQHVHWGRVCMCAPVPPECACSPLPLCKYLYV